MNEQLSLFTIHPVQVAKPKIDPYWDEITARQPEIDDDTVNSVSSMPSASKFQNQEPGLKGLGYSVSPSLFPKKSVGAQVTSDTKKVAPQHDTHWIEKYWVQRAGNKYWYYRYCWMTGRKKNRLYIGSVESAIAKNRKSEVESAIADGQTPGEIQNLIRSWRNS